MNKNNRNKRAKEKRKKLNSLKSKTPREPKYLIKNLGDGETVKVLNPDWCRSE